MPSRIRYALRRHCLADGELTTVYVVRHPRASTRVHAVHFAAPRRLDRWCATHERPEALVGGFFLRTPRHRPLGELWVDGELADGEPVAGGYGPERGSVHDDGSGLRIARRRELPAAPAGTLVQAGPLLVRDSVSVVNTDDIEGFSAASCQFDSDITLGRHPRAALAVSSKDIIAVACDGRRSRMDAGLSLAELADLLVELGASSAVNLDGGGSTTLVHRGHLLNRPYASQDQPAPSTRPIVSALLFTPA